MQGTTIPSIRKNFKLPKINWLSVIQVTIAILAYLGFFAFYIYLCLLTSPQ